MIPTRLTLMLGLLPLLTLLAGRGSEQSVAVAWMLWSLILGCWLVDAGLASRLKRRLEISRRRPAQLYVDQPHQVEWTVENRAPETVTLKLRDLPPESGSAVPRILDMKISGRTRVTEHYVLRVSERGSLMFGDAVCRLRGPLRLAWRQFRVNAAEDIRSLPHLANWKAAQIVARQALVRQIGSHRYRWRGAGVIFESLREYSPEDDIRWIDWKATARAQRPISRNYEVERHQNILLLVDSSRMMTTYCGKRTKFDAVLEAAVLLTQAALGLGDAVGLLLFSDHVETYLMPRRDQKQSTLVTDSLYAQYPKLVEPDFETALTLVSQRVRRRSLLILFTDVTIIEAAQRMLRYVQTVGRRHVCLVVTIADEQLQQMELMEPSTAEDLYRVGVASQLMLERAKLLEQVRRSGAEVLDSPADQVASRTIQRYLELKRRLRL